MVSSIADALLVSLSRINSFNGGGVGEPGGDDSNNEGNIDTSTGVDIVDIASVYKVGVFDVDTNEIMS